jgi:diphthamide synthase (EF-2-diphthine--ammonia ligase)
MGEFVAELGTKGIDCIAFGDLFLEDVRQYREKQLMGTGIDPLFPLWGIPTADLAEQMLAAGVEAYISSIDLKKLPSRCAGEKWSRDWIAGLPKDCDPCGENGEFHTVVVDGPMLLRPVPVRIGELIERNGFAYADIIPMNGEDLRAKEGRRRGDCASDSHR